MKKKMEELDIPPIPEFVEMIADTGAGMYACKASVDLFGLDKDDFIDQVAGHHHRRRVLRDGRRRPDHLHLTASTAGRRRAHHPDGARLMARAAADDPRQPSIP